MSRRHSAEKREVIPDAKFGDTVLAKFMNSIMYDGKKSSAEAIVYGAFDIVLAKAKSDPLAIFKQALENVAPAIEVRSRRVGGATYQVGAIHDRQGEPSDERRAIGKHRRAGSQRRREIRAGDGRPSVAHEAICARCEAQRVAYRAIGPLLRVDVNSTERSGLKTRSQASIAEQFANGAKREGKRTEQSGIRAERECWTRSNPGSAQGRKRNAGSNPGAT
jgi:hypothetical protein